MSVRVVPGGGIDRVGVVLIRGAAMVGSRSGRSSWSVVRCPEVGAS